MCSLSGHLMRYSIFHLKIDTKLKLQSTKNCLETRARDSNSVVSEYDIFENSQHQPYSKKLD